MSTKESSKTTVRSIRFGDELFQQVQEAKEIEGTTLNAFINTAVADYIQRNYVDADE